MDYDQMYDASGHSQTDKSIDTEMDVAQKKGNHISELLKSSDT